jgi:hypothetical protein
MPYFAAFLCNCKGEAQGYADGGINCDPNMSVAQVTFITSYIKIVAYL